MMSRSATEVATSKPAIPGRWILGTAVLAAWMLLVAGAHGQSSDTIRLQNEGGAGSSVRGVVQRMNKLNVTIEVGGVERRIDASEIRFITYANEPRQMRDARTSMLEGRDNRAYEDLMSIAEEELNSEFMRLERAFLIANAIANMALRGEQGTVEEARSAVAQLLQTEGFAENYNYYGAIRLIGDLCMSSGDFVAAEGYFDELAALPWPRTALEGRRLVAQSQLGQQKYQEAFDNFERVEADAQNDATAQQEKLRASIGRASALAGLDRADEGIAILEAIILRESSEDKVLFGQLYNALGACYLSAGNPKHAKHKFLHVDLLFYQDADNHAEALFHLVQLWAAENNVQNSNEARETLRARYPNSGWTSRL